MYDLWIPMHSSIIGSGSKNKENKDKNKWEEWRHQRSTIRKTVISGDKLSLLITHLLSLILLAMKFITNNQSNKILSLKALISNGKKMVTNNSY